MAVCELVYSCVGRRGWNCEWKGRRLVAPETLGILRGVDGLIDVALLMHCAVEEGCSRCETRLAAAAAVTVVLAAIRWLITRAILCAIVLISEKDGEVDRTESEEVWLA